MKRFLLLALTAGLLSPIPAKAFFGNKHFQTEQEARSACVEWARDQGEYIQYEVFFGMKGEWERRPRGWCNKNMSGKKFYFGRKVFVRREGEYDKAGEFRVDDVIRWYYKE